MPEPLFRVELRCWVQGGMYTYAVLDYPAPENAHFAALFWTVFRVPYPLVLRAHLERNGRPSGT